MKAFIRTVLVLVGCISLDPALAQPPKAPPAAPSDVDTIKQLVHDWADAMIATPIDIERLNQILADDWIDGYPGKALTKATFLDRIKSGKRKLKTCDFGPIDVKVLGNVAVVQGSATETRMTDGQLNTYRIKFMDVVVNRGGRWMFVRSQGTIL